MLQSAVMISGYAYRIADAYISATGKNKRDVSVPPVYYISVMVDYFFTLP